MQIAVTRKDIKFPPDSSRVIARFLFMNDARAKNTLQSVLEMTEDEVTSALSPVLRDYSLRHRNISKIFERHFNKHYFRLIFSIYY